MTFRFLAVIGSCLAALAPATTLAADDTPASPDPLYQKILALDTAMFDAFNK